MRIARRIGWTPILALAALLQLAAAAAMARPEPPPEPGGEETPVEAPAAPDPESEGSPAEDSGRASREEPEARLGAETGERPGEEPGGEAGEPPGEEPAEEPAEEPGEEPEEEADGELGGERDEAPEEAGETDGGEAAEAPPRRPPLPERLEAYVPREERDLTLVVTTDAPCRVLIDGLDEGEALPEEPLELTIRSTARRIRAESTEIAAAVWSEPLVIRDDDERVEVKVRMRRAIRAVRRNELDTGVSREVESGLMWARRDSGRDLDWEDAQRYCDELGLAGFDDWRLPTLAEMREMEAIWSRMPYKIRGGIVLTACCPWSSEPEGENRAWSFDYRFRRPFANHRSLRLGLRALCLREMSAEEIERAEELERRRKKGERKKDRSQDADEASGETGETDGSGLR